MKDKKSKSQKRIVFVLYCFFALTAICLIVNYYFVIRSEGDKLQRSKAAILTQTKASVEHQLSAIERLSYNLTQDRDIIKYMNGDLSTSFERYQLQERLNQLVNSNTYIDSIYLYAEKTGRILSSDSYGDFNEFSDIGWMESYRDLSENYSVFGRYTKKKQDTHLVISLMRGLSPSTGTTEKGAVVFNISTDLLRESFQASNVDNFLSLYITDSHGTVLYNNMADSYLSQHTVFGTADAEFSEAKSLQVTKGQSLMEEKGSEGIKFHYFLIESRLQTILQNYVTGFLFVLLMLFSILLLCFLIVWQIKQKVFLPMNQFMYKVLAHVQSFYRSAPGETEYDYSDLKELGDAIVENDQRMKEQISASQEARRWQLMIKLLIGEVEEYREIQDELKMFGIRLLQQNYIVMVSELDNYKELCVSLQNNALCVYVETISCELQRMTEGVDTEAVTIKMVDDKLVTLFSFPDNDIAGNMNLVLSLASALQRRVIDLLQLTVSMGVGGFYVDVCNVHNSYKEAGYALSYKFLSGCNAVISIEDIMVSEINIDGLMKQIKQLAVKNIREVPGLTEELFDKIEAHYSSPRVLSQLIVQIVVNLFENEEVLHVRDELVSEPQYHEIYERICQFETIQESRAYIVGMEKEILRLLDQASASMQNNRQIKYILEYIQEHYQQSDLSLNGVAEEFGYSAAHLSRIFKNVVKKNFIDYLIEIRIAKAKELLRDTNKKISEIGMEVGYVSAGGFMRIFKSSTGETPSEYRKRNS